MKRETIAEFLARGGKITKVPLMEIKSKQDSLKASKSGPAILMSLEEADLYYGEQRARNLKVKKKEQTIDISLLPEELRKKYIDEVLYGQDDEEI